MKSLLQLSIRFATLSVLTILVFFGGLIARLTQAGSGDKNKIAKNFGVNTAHADFTIITVQGVIDPGSSEGACESDAPQGDAGDPGDNC